MLLRITHSSQTVLITRTKQCRPHLEWWLLVPCQPVELFRHARDTLLWQVGVPSSYCYYQTSLPSLCLFTPFLNEPPCGPGWRAVAIPELWVSVPCELLWIPPVRYWVSCVQLIPTTLGWEHQPPSPVEAREVIRIQCTHYFHSLNGSSVLPLSICSLSYELHRAGNTPVIFIIISLVSSTVMPGTEHVLDKNNCWINERVPFKAPFWVRITVYVFSF